MHTEGALWHTTLRTEGPAPSAPRGVRPAALFSQARPDKPGLRLPGRDAVPELDIGVKGPRPSRVLVALDLGTENLKGGVLALYDSNDIEPNPSPSELLPRSSNITWSNNQTTMATEVAYILDTSFHPPVLCPQFGQDLERALDQEQIAEEDIIRHYKPLLFGDDIGNKEKTMRQVNKLSNDLQRARVSQGLAPGPPFEAKHLIDDLLAHAYRFTLRCIAEEHREFNWPIFPDLDQYAHWSPGNVTIEVALPLPVDTTPDQVILVKDAAERAGLPKPYIYGEPAAALTYHLARKPGQAIRGKHVMILDIGAGSADLDAWEVLQVNPLRVRQLSSSKTEWCGARTINVRCRDLLLESLDDIKEEVLASLRMADGRMGWGMFGDKLEGHLEAVKKDFGGNRRQEDSYTLRIPGLPSIPERGMPGGGRLIMDANLMRQAHHDQIHSISEMIQDAMREMQRRRGQITRSPDELIMAGGGSNNTYIRKEIRRIFEPDGIAVSLANAERSENTVALGSLLLLANKELVTERIARRAYCIGLWEPPGNRSRYPTASRERSEQDGIERVHMTRFFYRIGESLPRRHVARLKCWRGLIVEDVYADGGSVIEDRLWYSDTVSDDRLWLHRPGLDIHETPDTLRWKLPLDVVLNFDIEENEVTGKSYFSVDYELAVILEDDEATFQITIPRRGRFLDEPDIYGDDPIREQTIFDSSGGFKLVNAVADNDMLT